MSDVIYLDDYDDWEPQSAADDLVERVCPSPVLTSYTAALDFLSDWDTEDWFDSDDEYDNLSAFKPKKAADKDGKKARTKAAARHEPETGQSMKQLCARQPVMWKPLRERLASPELPVWKDGMHPKFSLLQDWRQRLQSGSQPARPANASGKGRGRPSRQSSNTDSLPSADATMDSEDLHSQMIDEARTQLPPTGLHSEEDNPDPERPAKYGYLNGTASSLAQKAMANASDGDGNTIKQGKKRKASENADTNGSVHHDIRPKRGRPAKAGFKSVTTEASSDKISPNREEVEQKQEQEGVQQPPLRKGVRGRPTGSTVSSKAASTAASTRKTRHTKH